MKKTAFVLASVILMNLLGAYGRTDVEEEKEQEQRIQSTEENDTEDRNTKTGCSRFWKNTTFPVRQSFPSAPTAAVHWGEVRVILPAWYQMTSFLTAWL